jgi:hypothetical protein
MQLRCQQPQFWYKNDVLWLKWYSIWIPAIFKTTRFSCCSCYRILFRQPLWSVPAPLLSSIWSYWYIIKQLMAVLCAGMRQHKRFQLWAPSPPEVFVGDMLQYNWPAPLNNSCGSSNVALESVAHAANKRLQDSLPRFTRNGPHACFTGPTHQPYFR